LGEKLTATLIKGGEVINPRLKTKDTLDILIHNGKVEKIARTGEIRIDSGQDVNVIDAAGLIVTPGLIDMHVHLREPGYEYKENILTGSKAAAAGGFTAVACMANTRPVNDSASVTKYILEKAKEANLVRVYPVAAVTKGEIGETITEFEELKAAGAVGFSDDGRPVFNSTIMRDALERASLLNMPVISHCEDLYLSKGGVMHEGDVSARLNLKGIPSASEEIMVIRDILLAKLTKCPVHIAHVSTEGSVRFIEQAKGEGIPVTAETAPHYFSLDHSAVREFGANAKMYPPLREQGDIEAIKKGLARGVIDVIATDHAPHSPEEKAIGMRKAPPGIIGLQTSLPLTLALVREGVMDLITAVERLTANPAKILGVSGGIIEEGSDADFTLIDLNREYSLTAEDINSKSRNSPFIGRPLKGKAVLTMAGGRIVYKDDSAFQK
jgi:dihydroorotase